MKLSFTVSTFYGLFTKFFSTLRSRRHFPILEGLFSFAFTTRFLINLELMYMVDSNVGKNFSHMDVQLCYHLYQSVSFPHWSAVASSEMCQIHVFLGLLLKFCSTGLDNDSSTHTQFYSLQLGIWRGKSTHFVVQEYLVSLDSPVSFRINSSPTKNTWDFYCNYIGSLDQLPVYYIKSYMPQR